MRRLVAVVGAVLGFAPAYAALASTAQVWQGTAFVTNASSACTSGGAANVGDYFTVVFRPAIASVQSAPEGLTFVTSRSVQLIESASAADFLRVAGTGKIVVLNSHSQELSTAAGTAPNVPYALAFKPASIVASTPSVTFTGTIQNFFGVSGCQVTLTASMDRRVG